MAKKETKRVMLWKNAADAEVFFSNFELLSDPDGDSFAARIRVNNDWGPTSETTEGPITTNHRWMIAAKGETLEEVMGQYNAPAASGELGTFYGEFTNLKPATTYLLMAWLIDGDNNVVTSEQFEITTAMRVIGSSVVKSSTYRPQLKRVGEEGGVPVIVNNDAAEAIYAVQDNNRDEFRRKDKKDVLMSASRDIIFETTDDPNKINILRWTRRAYDKGVLTIASNALATPDNMGVIHGLSTDDFVTTLYDGCAITDIFDLDTNQLKEDIGRIRLDYTQRNRCINDPDFTEIIINENNVCESIKMRDPETTEKTTLAQYAEDVHGGTFVDQYGNDLGDANLVKIVEFLVIRYDDVNNRYKTESWKFLLWKYYDDEGNLHYYKTLYHADDRVRPYGFKEIAVENLGVTEFTAVATYKEGFPKADYLKGDWKFYYRKTTETPYTCVYPKVDEPNNEARAKITGLAANTEYEFYFEVHNGDTATGEFTTKSRVFNIRTAETERPYEIETTLLTEAKTSNSITVKCNITNVGVPSVSYMTCFYKLHTDPESKYKSLKAPIKLLPPLVSGEQPAEAIATLTGLLSNTEYDIYMAVDNGLKPIKKTDVALITTDQADTPYKIDTPMLVGDVDPKTGKRWPGYTDLNVHAFVVTGYPIATEYGCDYRKSTTPTWTAALGTALNNDDITCNIQSLQEGTTYHVRFWIINKIGGVDHKTYSPIATFTTLQHWSVDTEETLAAISSGSIEASASIIYRGSAIQRTADNNIYETRPYIFYTDPNITDLQWKEASVLNNAIYCRVDNLTPKTEYTDVYLAVMATKEVTQEGKKVIVPDMDVAPFAETEKKNVTTKSLNYGFGIMEQEVGTFNFVLPINVAGIPAAVLNDAPNAFKYDLKYGTAPLKPCGATEENIIPAGAPTLDPETGALLFTLSQAQAEHSEGGKFVDTYVRVHVNNDGGFDPSATPNEWWTKPDYSVTEWTKIISH